MYIVIFFIASFSQKLCLHVNLFLGLKHYIWRATDIFTCLICIGRTHIDSILANILFGRLSIFLNIL